MVRHTLELGFKVNIKFFSKYSNKKDFTNTTSHNLKELFNAFKLHVGSAISELQANYAIVIDKNDLAEYTLYCKEVEELVDVLDAMDRSSESFRYPITNDNKAVFKEVMKLNLLKIEELFDKSMVLLRFTSSVIGQYTQELDYMNELFEIELTNSMHPY